jgi:Na+/melibiose symporter-like transporter
MDRLPTGALVAYAAPAVALQAMMVPLLLTLPTYFSVEVGLDLQIVGLMFMLARLWEAVTDPLIGAWSDRTRSRWGSRRPWMVAGVPIAIGATWFLVQPPQGASPLYLLAWLMIFYLGWSLVFIPYQSWGAEITGDFQDRTRVVAFREAGSFGGYLFATVAPIVVLQWWRGIEIPGWGEQVRVIGGFFAIALPLTVAWCLLQVPTRDLRQDAQHPQWSQLYRLLVRNRPFARLLGAYFLDRMSMGAYLAMMPLFVSFVLGMQKHFLLIALVISVASVAFCPLWVLLARRVGKHRSYVVANVITCLAYVGLFLAPPTALVYLLVVYVVLGLGNAGTMILPPSMTADAVDYDHLLSGRAQAGGHMAFLAFVYKSGMAAGVFVGLGFASLWGFSGRGGMQQAPEAMFGARAAVSLLPILLLLPAMGMMWTYPLDERRHGIIRAGLERQARRSGMQRA